ncbi:MAG: leucine-rich repeat domain-containing protein [Ruminococcaceae bacterium]|nr:leucine-rich repeat domain-containing protein [Oscillospiraceae bacterium]
MKKILFASLLVALLVCIFAVSVSAADIDYTKKVTLSDGTELPLYDENNESLLWFILSTDENGANTYASVPVNKNAADNENSYVTYKINSLYGTNQMHDIYIKYWDADAGKYVDYAEGTIVVANFVTFNQEYWSVGTVFNSANLEYLYHSKTVRSAGTFAYYEKLQVVDCSLATDYADFASQAFRNCTALREFHFGAGTYGLTCTNGNLFNGCTSLTTLTFAEGANITEIVGSAFYNCSSLTGTYSFPNCTYIGNQAFRYCATNEGCELILNFPNVVTLGANSGDTHVFSNSTGLKELYLGSSVAEMGHNTFIQCTGLEKIVFNGVADGFNFKSYTFEDCSALKAFSIPEGITALPQRMFKSCSSLKAVYLPSTLVSIDSGSQDHATFANCTNMYFVSSPFTFEDESDIPAKEDVYFFPSGLTTIAGGEVFKNCRNLNKTLVFGTGVTSITNAWAFSAGINNPTLENIVFLGNMENVCTSWANNSAWNFTGKIYFANANDKSAADVTMNGLASRSVFCNAEGNTTHLKEKTLATEANCENPKMVADYCFCGALISSVVEEGSVALGHKYDGDVTYSTLALLTAGTKYTACTNGCGTSKEESVTVLVALGYSASTFGETYSFSTGYMVDTDALVAYEAQNGVAVSFGFAFNLAEGFDSENATIDSFKLNAPIKASNNEKRICAFEYKMKYDDASNIATELVVGAYVVEKSEEGEELTFINKVDGAFEPVSYEIALAKSEK